MTRLIYPADAGWSKMSSLSALEMVGRTDGGPALIRGSVAAWPGAIRECLSVRADMFRNVCRGSCDVQRVRHLLRTREMLDGLRKFRSRRPAPERLGRDDAYSR